MDSDLYKTRKKMTAALLSIVMGVALALVANVRLFKPLDIVPADWLNQSVFDGVDLVLAGALMGLGTDWVHQVISILTKGQGFLGRASGGEPGQETVKVDLDQVKALVSEALQTEVVAQEKRLREEAERKLGEITRPGEPPG